MRSPNKSRSRSKNNRNRSNNNIGNIVNRVFDSNGPDGRVRGTPTQLIEKYEGLARDAQLSGDRVEAENFSQHAEHYIRLLAQAQEEVAREQARRQAEQDARNGNRADQNDQNNDDDREEMIEEDVVAPVDEAIVFAEDVPEVVMVEEKPAPTPKSKKPARDSNGFDDDSAPDFLKVIND